jgi:hypothetical protein
MLVLLKDGLNFYTISGSDGDSALQQKIVHLSVASYIYVLLYNAAKQMFTC